MSASNKTAAAATGSGAFKQISKWDSIYIKVKASHLLIDDVFIISIWQALTSHPTYHELAGD